MTQSEFIKKYCKESKITEKKLNKLGEFAVPCNCKGDICPGWAMVNIKGLKDHIELYMKSY